MRAAACQIMPMAPVVGCGDTQLSVGKAKLRQPCLAGPVSSGLGQFWENFAGVHALCSCTGGELGQYTSVVGISGSSALQPSKQCCVIELVEGTMQAQPASTDEHA